MSEKKARARIDKLLDADSFVELGALIAARSTDFTIKEAAEASDGVITGYGQIDGVPVYVYSQDRTVLNGTIGEMHAKKIADLYDKARRTGAPVIGLIDCGGFRLQESVDALDAFSKVLRKQILCSGELLMVTGVLGLCAGGMALIPALSDFTFMTKDARMFVNAPHTVTDDLSLAREADPAAYQNEVTGLAEVLESEEAVLAKIRALVMMLEEEEYGTESEEDLNRLIEVDTTSRIPDTRALLRECADEKRFLEICPACHPEMVTGFFKLNGILIGAAGNAPATCKESGGAEKEAEAGLTAGGCAKAAKFFRFCSVHDVPVLTVAAADGFAKVEETERRLPQALAEMMRSLARTGAVRVSLIAGDTYGSAYLAMTTPSLVSGAGIVFAWDTARVGMMEAEKAANILYARDQSAERAAASFEAKQNSVESAAAHGSIDAVIDPRETRKHLIMAFSML